MNYSGDFQKQDILDTFNKLCNNVLTNLLSKDIPHNEQQHAITSLSAELNKFAIDIAFSLQNEAYSQAQSISKSDKIPGFKQGIDNTIQIEIWERKYLASNQSLPSDIKTFYRQLNGIRLLWWIKEDDENCNSFQQQSPIGIFSFLSLEEIIQIKTQKEDGSFFAEHSALSKEERDCLRLHECKYAYVIDIVADGFVAFLLHESESKDKIRSSFWLIDLNMDWHFMCFGFTKYLLLISLHYGILGWHQMFTPYGVSPKSKFWMKLFCPERLNAS